MSQEPHNETEFFESASWDERYSGADRIWSGKPNAQLVAEVSGLPPGTALDVGCGEGGDVIWLAEHGWRVTGADFSANGLARAARHAEQAGVQSLTDWWVLDARNLDAGQRAYDLVTSCFLHPPDGGMVDVARRLAGAVAPGGHLLIVGHAPSHAFTHLTDAHRRAMFAALGGEQRPRRVTRDGTTMEIHDSTLLARRRR